MPCPYLEGQVERRMVTELSGRDALSLHDTLSRVGFRRSHGLVYAPICHGCNACLAVRTTVDEFRPSNSQRRVLKANADLLVEVRPSRATSEQYELFSDYQDFRHTGGDMATMDFYDFQSLIEETPVETIVLEYRLPEDNRLVGACLVDVMGDGLSAVYSFFDPALRKRSLGTYIILNLIDQAALQGLPYVYLGYWISGSQKMAYKDKFQPLEYYDGNSWSLIENYSPDIAAE
jgi:arginyl-tRNA--protein-N-Asp/Glu arginylyltransferase